MSQIIYTIGHSNGTVERLADLLNQHNIGAVADVRSRPYSRFNPQFNRENLARVLGAAGIEYVFLGEELGARSTDPSCYRNGRAQYSLIAKTRQFEQGIERLAAKMANCQVSLLCAEKEPLVCHRSILIGRYLCEKKFDVQHILEDGSLEDQEALLLRLLAEHGLREADLFLTKEERVAIAYEKQAEQLEYRSDEISQPA
jgi:uncharacterized protein (DUF488 family)